MNRSAVLLSLAAALSFVAGGAFMKTANGFARVMPGLMGIALFVCGAVAQIFAMKHAEMGVGYVFILGLEAVLAFAIGVLLFGESVSTAKVLGVVLIISGFALLHAGTSLPAS